MAFKVTLNGANYVSEERRRAFEKALEAQTARTASSSPERTAPAAEEKSNGGNGLAPVAVRAPQAEPSPSGVPAAVPPMAGADPMQVLESLERGLARSYDHQSETLQVHQHYLTNEATYASIFAQLMREQSALFGNGHGPEQSATVLRVLESLTHSIEQFHRHQSETLSVHNQFLNQQAAYAQAFVDLLQQQYGSALHGNGNGHVLPGYNGKGNGHGNGQHTAPAPTPVTLPVPERAPEASVRSEEQIPQPVSPSAIQAPSAPAAEVQAAAPATVSAAQEAPASGGMSVSTDELATALLNIVSDKTGYPAEMLELEMDMEADLGIDSIKRVEILGALQETYPNLPEIETDALSELRTLAQILAYTESKGQQASAAPLAAGASPTAPAVAAPAAPPVPSPAETGEGADATSLGQELLEIVSEKTGYPAEMLELEMDMEADLGIDSIKRVEILGALQERHPDLPEVATDALSELRTLAQILAYIAQETPKKG